MDYLSPIDGLLQQDSKSVSIGLGESLASARKQQPIFDAK
jgi:hypothetical protein